MCDYTLPDIKEVAIISVTNMQGDDYIGKECVPLAIVVYIKYYRVGSFFLLLQTMLQGSGPKTFSALIYFPKAIFYRGESVLSTQTSPYVFSLTQFTVYYNLLFFTYGFQFYIFPLLLFLLFVFIPLK